MTDIDRASKTKGLAWVIAAVILAATFALGISPFVRAIPWSWEENISHFLGTGTLREVCGGDPKKDDLLKRLVDRLYPLDRADARFSIHVQIIRDPAVNAFAELGGRISLNTGLLEQAESAEEVAGVLAHEIEHVRRRHIMEGFIVRLMTIEGIRLIFSSGGSLASANWTNYFLHMGFSHSQEAEADEGALARLQKAHIDNQGIRDFFERMKGSAFAPPLISDHPSNQARSEMAGRFQNQDTKPVMTKEEWKSFKEYCR